MKKENVNLQRRQTKTAKFPLYANIKMICKQRGISVRKLERENGVSNGSIAKWANSAPNIEALKKIADYLNVSVDALMGKSPTHDEGMMIGESKTEYGTSSRDVDIHQSIQFMMVRLDRTSNPTYKGKKLTPAQKKKIKSTMKDLMAYFDK